MAFIAVNPISNNVKKIDVNKYVIDCFTDCVNLSSGFENIKEICMEERLFYEKYDNCEESVKAINNILKCKNLKKLYINSFPNDLLNELAELKNLVDVQIMKYEKIDGFICGNSGDIFVSKNKNALVTLHDKSEIDNIIETISKTNVINITLLIYDNDKCEKVCNNLSIECEEIKIIFNLTTTKKMKLLENINLSNLPPLLKTIKILFKYYAYHDSQKKKDFTEECIKSVEIIKRRILNKAKIPYSCQILFE